MIDVATAARGLSRQNQWSTPRRRGGRCDGVDFHAIDATRFALNLGPRRSLHDGRGETSRSPLDLGRAVRAAACGGGRTCRTRWTCLGLKPVSRRRAIEQTSRKRRGGRPARPRAGLASMAWRSTSRPSRRVASMAWRPLRPRPSTRCRRVTSDGLGRLKLASVVLNRSTHRLSTWRGPPHRQRRLVRGACRRKKFCSELVIDWH